MYIDPVQSRVDSNELNHHGILGMKWGIRRYQNKDGSLTPAGMKRYGRYENAYKDFKKAIKKERVKQYGFGNQWGRTNSIGPNSKAALDKSRKIRSEVENSKEYKDHLKRLRNVERRFERGDLNDIEDYDREYEKELERFNKTELGKKYAANQGVFINFRNAVPEYANGAGKEITMGYLKDLGLNDKTAKKITELLIKNNRVLE